MNKSDSLKMRIRPICLLQINEEEKSRSKMIKAVISSEEKCQGLESHGETFHTEFVLSLSLHCGCVYAQVQHQSFKLYGVQNV